MEPSHAYDDIIDLPHHVSKVHPQMPMLDRAAQFSPFAALTGYDAAIVETARLTDEKRELTEEQQLLLNEKLSLLQQRSKTGVEISAVYFEPDSRKEGGAYRSVRSSVKKVDAQRGMLELQGGLALPFDAIWSLEII